MLTALLLFLKRIFPGRAKPVITSYTSNPALKTVFPGYPGTPLDQNGLFINHGIPTVNSFSAVLKFLLQRNPQREEKKKDTWRLEVLKDDHWLTEPSDKIVWLGHASFFIQLSGIRILIDPIFGKLPVGKRYSKLPVDPQKLSDIDYILVSHAHYDHCDKSSLNLLASNNPNAQILCGLNLDLLIRKWIANPTQTAGWYQQYRLSDRLAITFLPSRHWANRTPFDTNKSLWGGFMIQSDHKTIYYGGDSGYGAHFETIGRLFPEIDLALIGAGAYSPAWFMAQHHLDPYDAVKAFHETGAKTMIPFHYGTFDAADEPLGEPEKILKTLDAAGKIGQQLKIVKPGEVFVL